MEIWGGLILVLQLAFYLAIIGLVLYLQIKLSDRENKYLGLILPLTSFILAGLITLGFAQFNTMVQTVDNVREVTHKPEVLNVGLLLLVTNIPTAILSGIYYSERSKRKLRKEIEKMRIEDL